MTTTPALLADSKRFFWDGRRYPDEPQARAAADAYQRVGFEVRVVVAEGEARVYTRRPAAPPASGHQ